MFTNGSLLRMTTTKQYDHLNRLTAISSSPSAGSPVSFNYSYNSANQRTQDKLADGSYWVYQYDSLGQVTAGHKYFYDGTPVPGQQFDYGFDTIGNRLQTLAGGDQAGANQRLASYTVNNLNQITQRDFPGTNDIIGVALATNSVQVNSQTAWRKGEYFWSTVKTNNSDLPAWLGTIATSAGLNSTGNVYLAQSPEHFVYDADGNLTSDGRWNYTWDAENRLAGMAANTTVGPQSQLTFAYDAKGRRIQKVVTNGGNVTTSDFLYDGWNLIAILNPQSSILQSFMWGTDLSGSMQGAGGVGGLLEMSYNGSSTTNCFPAFDGNGNVAALVNAANGTIVANYEYGPFGEVIRSTGPMAKANPIRFSTKYDDDESDLLYYGYRYYKPSTGTWVNRDPINERGGINLYDFVWNEPVGRIDALGLYGGGVTFGEKAGCVCSCGYTACKTASQLAQQALAEAAQRYPTSTHNGNGDAFRHCYWSCQMTRAIGFACAKYIGDSHEAVGNNNGQPPAEYNMDSNNNSVGRSLAKSAGDCGDLCKKALDDGKLTVITP